LALALEAAGKLAKHGPDAALIAIGEAAARESVALARRLRAAKLGIEMLSPDRKLKALIGRADKIGARYAVIVGDDELKRGMVQLRDLRKSEQREVNLNELESALTNPQRD
ncbi:MAG: His/Gly/Thr/Pro-type tRNA ligase C-terminal domain-containing protein, partial [Candidatus Binataceae bacterium]